MKVDHQAAAYIFNNPQSRFAFVQSPYFVATDLPWQNGALNFGPDSGHFVSDFELQAIYPAPVFVPHNQCTHPQTGRKNALWHYWLQPSGGGQWLAQFQMSAFRPISTAGAFGYHGADFPGPGVAWKIGPTNNATYDFNWNTEYEFVQVRVIPEQFLPPGKTWYDQPADVPRNDHNVTTIFDQNFKKNTTKSEDSRTGLPAAYTGGRTLDIYSDGLNCQGLTFMWLMSTPSFATGSTLEQSFPISNASNPRSGPIEITTTTPHGFNTGDAITIVSVAGNTAANGEWTITVTSDTTFTLDDSTSNGDYEGNGYAFPLTGSVEFFFTIGQGVDTVTYRILITEGTDPVLFRQYTGAGETKWLRLRTLPWGSEPQKHKTLADNTFVQQVAPDLFDPFSNILVSDTLPPQKQLEVRLIAGRLQIRMNAGDQAYTVDELRISDGGNLLSRINMGRIRATYVRSMTCSMHPMKFRANARYQSPEIPIGFASDNFSGFSIDYAGEQPDEGNWASLLDDSSNVKGPTVQFGFFFWTPTIEDRYKGVEYVGSVPAIRAINLSWEPVIRPAFPFSTQVAPERIVTRSVFDLDTLSITWDGELWFNANGNKALPDGSTGAWGAWSMRNGQKAAEVYLARTNSQGFMSSYFRAFTGYAHTKGQTSMNPMSAIAGAGGAMQGTHFQMSLMDRHIQLMSDEFALPWMDGWNVFFAVAYLAQLGGVDISDMTFRRFIPDVPFGDGSDLGSPEGTPAYYLPVGDGGSLLTRYSGLAPWAIMQKIAYSIGYMLYFDVNGQLSFNKFTVPDTIKRTFYESDKDSVAQPLGGMEGCKNVVIGKDHAVIRNTTVVAGINAFAPLYDPIVVKYEDYDSLNNPGAFNYLGYRQRFAWIDSQFADPYFADQAAQKLYAYLRMPAITADFEPNWLQPDIFAGDVIRFQSYKTGTAFIPMLVTSVIHDVTIGEGRALISARHVPL